MPAVIAWTISSSLVIIAFAVWGLFVFYARRSGLEADARRRFAIASGAALLGWLVPLYAVPLSLLLHVAALKRLIALQRPAAWQQGAQHRDEARFATQYGLNQTIP